VKTAHPTLVLLLSILTACSGAPRPETSSHPGGEADRETSAAAGVPITRALDAALARGSWQDLRIDSECREEGNGRWQTVRLLGTGVGFWNNERQFAVSRERLLDLLGELHRAKFGSMRETYGEEEEEDWGLQMVCRVSLALDGAKKQSFQLSEGERSARLRKLAEKILAAGAELGPSGVAADSLEDGLDKIARGELAPEALTLQLHRQPEDPKSSEVGWILRIEDGSAQISLSTAQTAWTEPRRVRLPQEKATDLVRRLAAVRPGELPVNLYSSWYEDLEIRVLNRKATLQARRFASLTPETHGEKQKRFEQLIAALEELKGSLFPEGQARF
jgi:hypothetical protein